MNRKSSFKIYVILLIAIALGMVAVSISAQYDNQDSVQEMAENSSDNTSENILADSSDYPGSCCDTNSEINSGYPGSDSCCRSVSEPKPSYSDSRNRGCCSN